MIQAMPVFYANRFVGQDAILDEEESRHLIRVLRFRKNDPLDLVDGMGTLFRGIIIDPDPGGTRVRIRETIRGHLMKNYDLHLAISPTKSADRFEWFLEKATEIGIDEITPVLCERSERRQIRQERSEKILLAAMKQSGRALLPKLHPPVPIGEFLNDARADVKFLAHCRVPHGNWPARPEPGKRSWLLMIGPEGDFSTEEIELALSRGFREISLGNAVYRTETAGVIACMLVNFLHR